MKLTDVKGIGEFLAEEFKSRGLGSVRSVADASIEQLVLVPGLGPRRAQLIRDAARDALGAPDALESVGETEQAEEPAPAGVDEPNAEKLEAKTSSKKKSKSDRKKEKKGKKDKRGRKKAGRRKSTEKPGKADKRDKKKSKKAKKKAKDRKKSKKSGKKK